MNTLTREERDYKLSLLKKFRQKRDKAELLEDVKWWIHFALLVEKIESELADSIILD